MKDAPEVGIGRMRDVIFVMSELSEPPQSIQKSRPTRLSEYVFPMALIVFYLTH